MFVSEVARWSFCLGIVVKSYSAMLFNRCLLAGGTQSTPESPVRMLYVAGGKVRGFSRTDLTFFKQQVIQLDEK